MKRQRLGAVSVVVYPDGCINEDHAGCDLLRGMSSSCGWLPPSLASLRAASRCTRARRPSCINAVRSEIPVYSAASARSSSSILIVVLIAVLHASNYTSFDACSAASTSSPNFSSISHTIVLSDFHHMNKPTTVLHNCGGFFRKTGARGPPTSKPLKQTAPHAQRSPRQCSPIQAQYRQEQ